MTPSLVDKLSADAWQLVLELLPLRSLASLAACSKALHALVAKQPEAVWKAAAAHDSGAHQLCSCLPGGLSERADTGVCRV